MPGEAAGRGKSVKQRAPWVWVFEQAVQMRSDHRCVGGDTALWSSVNLEERRVFCERARAPGVDFVALRQQARQISADADAVPQDPAPGACQPLLWRKLCLDRQQIESWRSPVVRLQSVRIIHRGTQHLVSAADTQDGCPMH